MQRTANSFQLFPVTINNYYSIVLILFCQFKVGEFCFVRIFQKCFYGSVFVIHANFKLASIRYPFYDNQLYFINTR